MKSWPRSSDWPCGRTTVAGLDIIPCTEDFMGADLIAWSAQSGPGIHVFGTCLKNTKRLGEYDIVLMDNSPSISLVVMNSLVASDYFLVPCSAEYLPMLGLSLLGGSIGRMSKLAPNLQSLGVVLTMYSRTESGSAGLSRTRSERSWATRFLRPRSASTQKQRAPRVCVRRFLNTSIRSRVGAPRTLRRLLAKFLVAPRTARASTCEGGKWLRESSFLRKIWPRG